MLHQRYGFLQTLCGGKDVLEVACGPGFGLGALAKVAKSVVGVDCDPEMVRVAQEHHGGWARVLQADAQALPFADGSLDVVAILEAIYYLPDVALFVREARRVLRPQGKLVIVSANCEWELFNAGAYAVNYLSAGELAALLRAEGFEPNVMKAYADELNGARERAHGFLRKAAVSMHLIPAGAKGKERIKRFLYGKLEPIPADVDPGLYPPVDLEPVRDGEAVRRHKTLFAVGTLV